MVDLSDRRRMGGKRGGSERHPEFVAVDAAAKRLVLAGECFHRLGYPDSRRLAASLGITTRAARAAIDRLQDRGEIPTYKADRPPLTAAERDRAAREHAARERVNPFRCGHALADVTNMPAFVFKDYLQEDGIRAAKADSSARLYWETARSGWSSPATIADPVTLPVGFTMPPFERTRRSRRQLERRYSDVVLHSEPAAGGHFLALEQPDVLVDDVRSTFALLR